MISRYSRKELVRIWSEENKYKIWLDVEVAAAEAAVGLAILLSLYRNRVTVDMESFNLLKW